MKPVMRKFPDLCVIAAIYAFLDGVMRRSWSFCVIGRLQVALNAFDKIQSIGSPRKFWTTCLSGSYDLKLKPSF